MFDLKSLLRLEYPALFLIFGYLLLQNQYASWWLLLLFWIPDFGYTLFFIKPKWGVIGYNFTHFIGTGFILLFLGWVFKIEWLIFAGLLDLAHIHFDRALGYGLKSIDNPNFTHLGFIGKEKYKNKTDSKSVNI